MPIAYQYCTGPVHLFYSYNLGTYLYEYDVHAGSEASYIGTCEQYPLVQGIEHWDPTFNDIAGTLPFDKQYFGDTKLLVLDINKMVQESIDNLINFGREVATSRGSYKNEQGNSFTLWLQFQNFGTPAAIPGLPPGEVYFNCNIAENGYDPIGTRSRKTRLIVEADPAYTVNNTTVSPTRGFGTYSIDPSFFVGLPTNIG